MVLKCVWNNIEVSVFIGSVSFRKTTLTGMCYEVPAFAGMTTLLGDMGRFQPSLESVQITPDSRNI
jgi:hypothetical protein